MSAASFLPIIDRAKLLDYCLNEDHPKGKHKALVFNTVLGWTAANIEILIEILKTSAINPHAVVGKADQYGMRHTIDTELTMNNQKHILRDAWIILRDEDFPRLTTCYLLKKGK